MEFTTSNIEKLVDLLRAPEPDVLQGDDFPSTKYDITVTRENNNSRDLPTMKTPKTIEEYESLEAEEAENMGKVGFGERDRKTPVYTMNYLQSVSAEDVFLQMGPKTPSSASCENLVVRVKMPEDKKENVDLDVDTSSVTINSSRYYLKLPLPHEINPDTSKATWDSTEETLVLTLKLQREFDFVNF
ncbi:dynein axonemal assembly factor 6 [Bicyclus anynana]|uniref:Dynein axonemal assembly factor 6 n=1 Tax=Bicyclus anynana TaxID=110368 RepID=A0A6J1MU16_BICAN|nr:dynein axonemal assembly factor 6 [Bicyclus anynana]